MNETDSIPYNVCLSCGDRMCDHALCLSCEGCDDCSGDREIMQRDFEWQIYRNCDREDTEEF